MAKALLALTIVLLISGCLRNRTSHFGADAVTVEMDDVIKNRAIQVSDDERALSKAIIKRLDPTSLRVVVDSRKAKVNNRIEDRMKVLVLLTPKTDKTETEISASIAEALNSVGLKPESVAIVGRQKGETALICWAYPFLNGPI